MGLRIKSNRESLQAQHRLEESRKSLGESLERLSSGQRINKSADDAAGLAVSESMRARIKSLEVAKRNSNDGISFIQIAEGGLNEVTNTVTRMRELAMQAASDTLGSRERSFLNKEFQELRKEVDRIIQSTEFNGNKILTGENSSNLKLFVGASYRGNDLEGNSPDIDPDADPDIISISIDDVVAMKDAVDALTQDDISIVPDGDGGAADLGPSGTADLFNRIDTSLNSIANFRATLGSVQSRLNSAIANIDVTTENLAAAQSRIRDVDYASETARYAASRILTQGGVSVLMQANQAPEFALQLLR